MHGLDFGCLQSMWRRLPLAHNRSPGILHIDVFSVACNED
jgi:hypothetical protein